MDNTSPEIWREYPNGHIWQKGEIDGEFLMFEYKYNHYGPMCIVCGFKFCKECGGNNSPKTPCDGTMYKPLDNEDYAIQSENFSDWL